MGNVRVIVSEYGYGYVRLAFQGPPPGMCLEIFLTVRHVLTRSICFHPEECKATDDKAWVRRRRWGSLSGLIAIRRVLERLMRP